MAKAATMFLLAGAARALRGHRLHHLARPSRTVMSAATLDRTTPTKLQDAESFLKDIDVFIFDCDGVIWKGDSVRLCAWVACAYHSHLWICVWLQSVRASLLCG